MAGFDGSVVEPQARTRDRGLAAAGELEAGEVGVRLAGDDLHRGIGNREPQRPQDETAAL